MSAKYGLKLSKLTLEILKEVAKIYDEVVGGHASTNIYPGTIKYIKETFSKRRDVEWRFGSKLSIHSKLWVTRKMFSDFKNPTIYFSFDPNIDKYEEKILGPEAKVLEEKFEKAVDEYLQKQKCTILLDV